MKRSTLCWLGSCIGAALLFLATAYAVRGVGIFHPRPIIISRRTTWLTTPLAKGGGVDFIKWLNDHDGQGLAPQKNAAVALLQTIGIKSALACNSVTTKKVLSLLKINAIHTPHPFMAFAAYARSRGWKNRKSLPDSVFRRWRDGQHPHVAAWLADQRQVLHQTAIAVRMKRAYFPVVRASSRIYDIESPLFVTSQMTHLASALCVQSLFWAGRGRYHKAWRCVNTEYKLGLLLGRGPFLMNVLLGNSITGEAIYAAESLATADTLPPAAIHEGIVELRHWPRRTSLASTYAIGERIRGLARIQHWARHGLGGLPQLLNPNKICGSHLNFNAIMMAWNNRFDQLVTADRAPTYALRDRDLQRVTHRFQVRRIQPDAQEELFDLNPIVTYFSKAAVTRCLFSFSINWPLLPTHLMTDIDAHKIMLRLALALRAYRAGHRGYPSTLVNLVPRYLNALPDDPFTGRPPHYCVTKNAQSWFIYCFERSVWARHIHRTDELTLTTNWPGPHIRRHIVVPINMTPDMMKHPGQYGINKYVTRQSLAAEKKKKVSQNPPGFPPDFPARTVAQ